MAPALPKNPSIEYLEKQAKFLLAAHRTGDARCCVFLKQLKRFKDSTDDEILDADVALTEVQFVIAMFYDFASWDQLRKHVEADSTTNDNSIDSVVKRCRKELPDYAGAGVPLGVVAALNHAGIDIDFMDFVASTGWAFSFGYKYDDVSAAYMAVRGNPKEDGPLEVFSFIPAMLGFDYEFARTGDREALWSFAIRHVDAGTPIMSEHIDGGLITGYREVEDHRQLYFDGTVMAGWTDVDQFNPYAVYVLAGQSDPLPQDEINRRALRRAVAKGSPHNWQGIPQGMAALQTYFADVTDPDKGFTDTEEWFCWATFERLMARFCCEEWLHSIADQFDDKAGKLILTAADHYGEAFRNYRLYREAFPNDDNPTPGPDPSVRTAEFLNVVAPMLESGIAAEAAGLDALKDAVGSAKL